MNDSILDAEQTIVEMAMSCYATTNERAAVRGGMSDAAHLGAKIGNEIRNQHTRKGGICKHWFDMAQLAFDIADAIDRMRDKIEMPEAKNAPQK